MSNEEDDERAAHLALLGQVIAHKFKLVRLLGAGGMGAVYEAEDVLLKRRVALKLMKPEVARNKSMAERFIREGRAANAIDHKNIVRVFDLAMDEENSSLFIVQELLSGESLAEKLQREHKLSVGETVVILDSVLEALQFAHEKGIVHRDIKPDNVFLHRGPDGEIVPKIIDFGISKVTAEQQEGLAKTQTGTALGTPYYMSPEQIRGDSDIDHRADLWSAGVMAFEMLTGRRPFTGDNYNMLIINIITSPAPDATAVDPSVPYAISQVIARSLKMDRAQRYETARALREALDEAVLESGSRSSQVIALTPSPVRPAAVPATTSGKSKVDPIIAGADSLAALSVEPPTPSATTNGKSSVIYAVGALVVGLAIAGGAVALRASNAGSTASQAARAPQTTAAPPPETTVAARPQPSIAAQPHIVAAQASAQPQAPAPVTVQPASLGRGSRSRSARGTTATGPAVTTAVTTANAAAVNAATAAMTVATATATERPQEDPAAQPARRAPPERAPEPESAASNTTANSAGSSANSGSTTSSGPRRFRFVTTYPGAQNPGTQ
jgi:serine/threonine-protein kinase